MEYNRIVAVTGMPGLFEVISSKADGAIVRSLDDQTTKFVSSRVHNLSHLESIEIYTIRENVSLVDVFNAIKANGGALPNVKDNKALKSYFEKVYPDMDFERVYTSDMKKMVKWYEVLQANNVDFTVRQQEANEEPAAGEEAETEKKPKSKKAKATAEAGADETATATAEAPKKPRKKKAEE